MSLPTITVEARPPAVDPPFEINSATVLDRDTLARSEKRELNGVFRGLPGVILQTPGSRGSLSGLFVRGASAGLGQLNFDGVPLYSSLNGIFNLATVPVDALERVEIVRGASGPRYGSRALGGVIRLESRDAREDGGFLHLEGGSYNTLSETVGGALRGAKARAIVTASRDDIFEDISWADSRNGNPERDGFRTTQLSAQRSADPQKLGPLPAIARGDRRPGPPPDRPDRLRGRPRRLCPRGHLRSPDGGARAHPGGLGVQLAARLHPQPRQPPGLQRLIIGPRRRAGAGVGGGGMVGRQWASAGGPGGPR